MKRLLSFVAGLALAVGLGSAHAISPVPFFVGGASATSGNLLEGMIWEFDASSLSLAPVYGSGTPTITRAGNTATRVNSSGLIEVVNADLPRFDYDPVTLAVKGLLVEEARTNLLLRSAEFDNASWTKTDTTVTADNVASPDGGTNADLLTEGVAGTALCQQNITGTANATYATSVFLKRGNHDWVRIVLFEAAASANRIDTYVNLNTGALGTTANNGTASGATATISGPYNNGFYRVTLVGAINNGATALSYRVQSATADATNTRVNNGTRYQWGAQFENNVAFATSYIPTAGATVTRAADVITLATASIPGFSASTLTMYVEAYAGIVANGAHFITIGDTTANERHRILMGVSADRARAISTDGGATQADLSSAAASWPQGTINKAAYAVAANDAALVLGGGTPATDATVTMPTPTEMHIGKIDSSSASFLNSHIRKLRLYSTRKSNSQLQAMTQ